MNKVNDWLTASRILVVAFVTFEALAEVFCPVETARCIIIRIIQITGRPLLKQNGSRHEGTGQYC